MGGSPISAGALFELLRPLAFALSILASTLVLASTLRNRFPAPAAIGWTLGTFGYPTIAIPLYLIAWSNRRRRNLAANAPPEAVLSKRVILFPTLYAVALFGAYALYFSLDHKNVDSHLARANQYRVMNDRPATIREYREALRLEDDAHTHNLLAIELAASKNWREALDEFKVADGEGEPDDRLPFNIAAALAALGQPMEAAQQYRRFLASRRCATPPADALCDSARARLAALSANSPR